jgi:hypothetical protein
VNNKNYCSIDGVLYSKDKKTLIRYPEGRKNTKFVIPNTVTTISDNALSHISSLTEIVIPSSVTTIRTLALWYCNSITRFTVDENNKYFCSIDGVLYSKDKKTLIRYPEGRKDTKYVILDSVTSINSSAFYYCESLTEVVIPSSVTSIGSLAFDDCKSLTKVVIPSNVTSIGPQAFAYCENAKIHLEKPKNIKNWSKDWNKDSVGKSYGTVYDKRTGKEIKRNIFGNYVV